MYRLNVKDKLGCVPTGPTITYSVWKARAVIAIELATELHLVGTSRVDSSENDRNNSLSRPRIELLI